MENTPQSERGAGWSLPTPPDLQQPLAPLTVTTGAGASLTLEKSPSEPPQTTTVAEDHAKFSDEVHSYIREHIRNADQKATFFFAALTAILAFLNTQNVPTRWLKDVRQWSFVDALGLVSMLGLAVGAGILLAVVFPRLKGSRQGIIFFKAIAEHENSSKYVEDVLARPGHYLVRTKLEHCYDLSRICSAKYRLLRTGFWVGSTGAAAALLFLLFAKRTTQ